MPFFTISGSDFVEMFVGVGASRVRDMFDQAKKHAPCIIFIDEIDAVGRHRGAGLGGGHDEREQTLNQLLVEMDGFEGNEGVIVIAATNRPDVLDPALLRPGRFDRQVVVPLPDVRGREQILKVHMRKVPVDGNVKPSVIARGTPGFSGADLANLVNEAALIAARSNRRTVSMEEFDKAKDKIMMGAERRSLVMSEAEKKLTAYHESGHAIVGLSVPDHDPVYKVTIIPRGRALGVTMFLPEEDRYSYSKQRLMSQMKSLYGGRLAEELVFGPAYVTTGAVERHRASDRHRAQHGHEVGPVRSTRSADVHRGRRRDLPRPQRDASQAGVRRHRARDRRGSADADRQLLRRGEADPREQPRQARRDGRRAHEVRDDRREADQGHHGGPRARGRPRIGTSRRSPASSRSARSRRTRAPRRSAGRLGSTSSRRKFCRRRVHERRISFPRHAKTPSLGLDGAHPCAPTVSGRTFGARGRSVPTSDKAHEAASCAGAFALVVEERRRS